MGNKIEWFVVELQRMLGGKMPQSDLDDLKKETRSHLSHSAESWTAPNRDESLAESVAIERFGTPEVMAIRYLREFKGRRSALGFWMFIIASFVLFVFPFAAFFFAPELARFDTGAFHVSALILSWILMSLFFVCSCFFVRRRALSQLAFISLLGFSVCTLLTASSLLWVVHDGNGFPVSKREASNVARDYERFRGGIEETSAKIIRAKSVFRKAFVSDDIPPEFRSSAGFLVPRGISFGGNTTLAIIWKREPDFARAKHDWLTPLQASANEYLRQAGLLKATAETYRASTGAITMHSLTWSVSFWSWYLFAFFIVTSIMHLLVLAIQNALERLSIRRAKLA